MVDPVVSLRAECDRLSRRLEDGDRRIAKAERAGQDVAAWESFWIELLQEYEGVYRMLVASLHEQMKSA